eukprot:4211019-Pyramimonas_sp.AAC.1
MGGAAESRKVTVNESGGGRGQEPQRRVHTVFVVVALELHGRFLELHGAPDDGTSEPRGGWSETPNRADEHGVQRVVNREGGSQGGRDPQSR